MSSAAAGISLIAAALVLVIGVSALIGFRGFESARQVPAGSKVVLQTPSRDREAGASATPAPVVIGGRRSTPRRRDVARRRPSVTATPSAARARARVRKAPVRSGLSAPARRKPKAPASEQPAAPAPAPAPTAAAPADPVGKVVEEVGKIVEKPTETVGDVLLDLRDVLP